LAPTPNATAPSGPTPAPSAGTMSMPNPAHLPCPVGYGDKGGVLATDPWNRCNKICSANKECTAPYTCQNITGDGDKVCWDR
jgi:hypothetical protein